MKRRRVGRPMRVRIFEAAAGVCCICSLPIDAVKQRWIVEHVKPLWLGGADDESNMRPAHASCGIAKTTGEAPVRAKSDRIRAKRFGIRKPRTIRGWRKFNGQRVFAPRER